MWSVYKEILADMSHRRLERTCLNIETLHLFVQKSMIHPKTHIGGTGIGLVLQFKKELHIKGVVSLEEECS